MADWVLAIDFGTTSTAAAMRVGELIERIELDGSPRLPSMVFWHEGTGSGRSGRLVVGEEADQLSGLAPECLERAPKRRIGDEFIRLGDKELRVTDVIGAILRKVAEEAMALRGGEPPREVRLTHPARWSQISLDKLRQAAETAGLRNLLFVAEPVAAATHFASQRLQPGQHVAVYDLGGGTFDTAVLRRTEHSFELAGPPGGDENLGGEDFDDRLYRYLGRQLSQDHWRQLQESSDRVWTQANRELLRSARRTKEFLSRSPRYEFYMPPPIEQELLVSAESFRELIVDDVQSTAVELERTVRAAGLEPSGLAAIYLAGGSSRIPLVGQVIQQRLGQTPESWDDPKAVTVLGAARLPTEAAAATTVAATTQARTREFPLVSSPRPPAAAAPLGRPPPAPPPERRRDRSGLIAALIVLGVVALAGIAAGALAAAGVFTSSSSTTTSGGRTAPRVVTRTVITPTTTVVGRQQSPSAGLTPCPEDPSVFVAADHTTCQFAIGIFNGYRSEAQQNGGPGNFAVSAHSDATGTDFTDSCTYDTAGQLVTCTHGNGEEVQFNYP